MIMVAVLSRTFPHLATCGTWHGKDGWCAFVQILLATYTANLTAGFTRSNTASSIGGIRDLQARGSASSPFCPAAAAVAVTAEHDGVRCRPLFAAACCTVPQPL
jgi:hypothetical protein